MHKITRVLLVSPNLQPEKCGVSDYSLVLKKQLETSFHCEVFCLALSDKYVTEKHTGSYFTRMPFSARATDKVNLLKSTLEAFQPDLLLFNYVSYGYNKLGLPAWLFKTVAMLSNRAQVHFILHELWVGSSKHDPWKRRMLGWLQKKLLLRLLQQFAATSLVTTSPVTAAMLGKIGIQASSCRVFNNITAAAGSGTVPSNVRAFMEQTTFLKIVMFGSMPPNAEVKSIIAFLVRQSVLCGKPVRLVSVGSMRNQSTVWDHLKRAAPPEITFESTGSLQSAAIAWIFQQADGGISTYPFPLWSKSGAIAAMAAHGLPVVVFGSFQKNDRKKELPPPQPRVFYHEQLPAGFSLAGQSSKTVATAAYNQQVFQELIHSLGISAAMRKNAQHS